MKVVILAGGLGTRLSEETDVRPKPMVEIGGRPILWHIMKIYAHYGLTDFIVCLGYKGYVIKEYFANYFLHQADVTIDLSNNSVEVLQKKAEPWKVTLLDTGTATMTGGRVKRVTRHVGNHPFMLTYGDGLSNVDLSALLEQHRRCGRIGTVTAVQPSGRFGALEIDAAGHVTGFTEKPRGDNAWINGGFFVFEPGIFEYIAGDDTVLERDPLERLAAESQLSAYHHTGFWKAMDTLRDRRELEELWAQGSAPWKVW